MTEFTEEEAKEVIFGTVESFIDDSWDLEDRECTLMREDDHMILTVDGEVFKVSVERVKP